MEQYISKDALVAKINELKKEVGDDEYWNGYDIALDEVLYFIDSLQEEPVSEELKEEITKYFSKNPIKHLTDWPTLKNTALHFANWQKEQFEKNRLAACDRQTEEEAEREQDFVMGIIENEHRKPTFDDAIKYGAKWQLRKTRYEKDENNKK